MVSPLQGFWCRVVSRTRPFRPGYNIVPFQGGEHGPMDLGLKARNVIARAEGPGANDKKMEGQKDREES